MKKLIVLVALLVQLSCGPMAMPAAPALAKQTESVVDARGMTLETPAVYGVAINGQAFQFEGITSFRGWQYAAYWVRDDQNAARKYHVAVARRKLPQGEWQVIDLPDSIYKNGFNKSKNPTDAHNTVSIGICPNDGTIHLAYDMHGHQLKYRVSDVGVSGNPEKTTWSAAIFHPQINKLGNSGVLNVITYPMFVRTPAGDMQMFLRTGGSGIGSNWVYDYDGLKHEWTGGRQFDNGITGSYTWTDLEGKEKSNPNRNAYPNAFQYGPTGRLYASWVWREGAPGGNGANHDVAFAYSEDGGHTWKNNAGEVVSNTEAAKGLPKQITINSPGLTVVPLSLYSSLMNTQGQAIDHADQVHILMWHRDAGTTYRVVWDPAQSSYHHSWRDAKGVWRTTVIPRELAGGAPGSRPRLVIDDDDNIYAIYTVRVGGDVGSNRIYLTEGKLIVAKATRASGWSDWKPFASAPGPFVNEPLVDYQRFAESGVLSVMMQDSPKSSLEATPIRVFDFPLGQHTGGPK
jgi:hypothetical protein